MRAHILGAGLALGLAVTVISTPVAWAHTADYSDNTNSDNTNNDTGPFLDAPAEPLAPGQELHIQGYCPDPAAGPLTSDVLSGIDVLHDPEAGPPNLNASGVVIEGTAPGMYAATMDCAGDELAVTFTVIESGALDLPADYVTVHPTVAHPGDAVAAQASCADTEEATLTSPVLQTVTLARDPEGHQPWALHGSTTVSEDAEPGDYPVSAQCAGGAVETTIAVLGTAGGNQSDGNQSDGNQAGRNQAGRADAEGGQVSRVPRGAPETGDWAEGSGGHISLPLLVLGLTLGAAAGAGAIAWREVRR